MLDIKKDETTLLKGVATILLLIHHSMWDFHDEIFKISSKFSIVILFMTLSLIIAISVKLFLNFTEVKIDAK